MEAFEEHGLPKGVWKIGVAVAANSERVYALIEARIRNADFIGRTTEVKAGSW